MSIKFITVEYGNPHDTEQLLDSVARLEDAQSTEVIVVDNASDRSGPYNSMNMPGSSRLSTRRLVPPENLYYWGGAVFAFERLLEESGEYPLWSVICNNDIEFESADFLAVLRTLDPSQYPIVAPAVISATTGVDDNPLLVSRPGRLQRLKWRLYAAAYPLAKGLLMIRTLTHRRSRRQKKASETMQRIYAPHGACVILSREFFARGGKLDTTVPLFAEEFTLAVTAERLGLPVWHYPRLRVVHREHSTTGKELTRTRFTLQRRAYAHYFGLLAGEPKSLN